MSPGLVGGVLGLVGGLGLALVLHGLPVSRGTSLASRVDPYVRDLVRPSRLLGRDGSPTRAGLGALLEPVGRDLARVLHRVLGSERVLSSRLRHAGRAADVDAYRLEQVLWAAAGLVVGVAACVLLRWRRDSAPLALVVLVLVAGAAGALARDWQARPPGAAASAPPARGVPGRRRDAGARRRCRRRAGGSGRAGHPSGARRGSPPSLGLVLADGRAGARIDTALQGLSDRTGLSVVRRFVDGMVVAIERGTPLADVLRAQAADVREARQREPMETAGRKEIAMMVPVVFVVLPVTVLFAVYPGFAFLRLGT
ncbi:pilus assembly protein TadB [Angustibacter aerolatus]|uniref:Pilus assembly protein TadB n=1 Tax=Angustibacter aerolatus TaxID=1162965 RepID=A0ABQ6JEX6_9ACTN|nr:type II secretion system F family protein [Angustibacter aerolatus]GMA85968.1 pilus assembly protein TadB [Angustibacter aerolatus]